MDNLERKIDDLILELEVPLRFGGSLYIRECLKLMLTNALCRIKLRQKGGCFNRVSDKLFDTEYDGKAFQRIERNIRYVKEYVQKHLAADKLERILRTTSKDRLTTKEFLIRLCKYIENN